MCRLCRRGFLTGAAALAAHTALPAWAQFPGAIKPQSDPYAQVDPYADPRNGFAPERTNPSKPTGAKANQSAIFSPHDEQLTPEELDEVKLGRIQYVKRIASDGGAYPDQQVQAALQAFCKPMFAVADRANLPWVVTMVNDPSPNASAGLGGTVIVNAGLLQMCDRPGELAATLAHEIGHVDKKHVSNGAAIAQAIDAARQAGIQPTGSGALPQLVPGSEKFFRDSYDLLELANVRSGEAEADAHEMVILERLGVDPVHAINDQKNFLTLEKIIGGGGPSNSWLRSHPLTTDRLQMVKDLAAMAPKPATDFVFDGWDLLKRAFPTGAAWKKS